MCYQNYFFCPKQFEYMTKKVMVLFLKYGGRFSFVSFFHSDRTKEGSFCVLSRTTKGLVIMIVISPDMGVTGYGGVGTLSQE